jgi:hypothetical protein
MILLSLNIRGVGGPLKLASLRRLLSKTNPNIIFLQEMLVAAEKARLFLNKIRPDWMVCVVSVVGTSGGLLASWDPNFFTLDPFLTSGGIFLSGISLLDNRKITLLNVYRPCQDRKAFWDSLDGSSLLAHKDLIIAGDLNFTTSSEEVWGLSTHVDSLAGYFKSLFIKNNLVDIVSAEVVPTWQNGRSGDDSIAKILDRFYVAEDLIASTLRYRTWVEFPFLSDHAPIFLEFGAGILAVAYPFKLNLDWMSDDSFVGMVRDVWSDLCLLLIIGAQRRLVGKLSLLKAQVKQWAKEKRLRDQLELAKIEEAIDVNYKQSVHGSFFDVSAHTLCTLEAERKKLLLAEEERWQKKSRAIWIKSGDKNTKFFHRFTSYRRNKKYIWEVKDENGGTHSGQQAIKDEAIKYFKSFFSETGQNVIEDQINSVRLFTNFVTEDDVHTLEKAVSKEEIYEILRGFSRDKSPSPDGWTVEFFFNFLSWLDRIC